jgi:hypothetical protein
MDEKDIGAISSVLESKTNVDPADISSDPASIDTKNVFSVRNYLANLQFSC